MQLLTAELRRFPSFTLSLGRQFEPDRLRQVLHAGFKLDRDLPTNQNYAWFITEGGAEGDDFLFLWLCNWVQGGVGLLGIFDLESVRGPWNLPIRTRPAF